MWRNMKAIHLALCLLIKLARGFTIQQYFTVPNEDEPDFSDTYYRNQTVPLQWNALNSNHDDLWVTSFDENIHHFHEVIARSIDLSVDGSYNWRIAIPSTVLAADAKYVHRFKIYAQPRTAYSTFTLELSSPGILVLNLSTISQSSSTPSPPHGAPNRYSPMAAQHSAAPTSDDLTTAAKTGIGIGISLGALYLLGLLLYFLLYRRKVRVEKSPPPVCTSYSQPMRELRKIDTGTFPSSPLELKGYLSPQ